MSRAFTKDGDEQAPSVLPSRFVVLPEGLRNLITPEGSAAFQAELAIMIERRQALQTAATIEAKSDLEALDLRIEELSKRLDTQVLTPHPEANDSVGFGSTVVLSGEDGQQKKFQIVGIDESNPELGKISYTSPLAVAVLRKKVGDEVRVVTPKGEVFYNVVEISTT